MSNLNISYVAGWIVPKNLTVKKGSSNENQLQNSFCLLAEKASSQHSSDPEKQTVFLCFRILFSVQNRTTVLKSEGVFMTHQKTTPVRKYAGERAYQKAMNTILSGGSFHELLEHLEEAAEKRHPGALSQLACMHGNGLFFMVDHGKEIEYLRLAAGSGYADAQAMLAYVYSNGRFGIKIDRMEANRWLSQALQQDSPFARAIASLCGLCGYERDMKSAKQQFELLSCPNQIDYARFLYFHCVEELYKINNDEYDEYGDEFATLILEFWGRVRGFFAMASSTFASPWSSPDDIMHALAALEGCCEAKDPGSMFLLGDYLLKNDRIEEGEKWLKDAAELHYGPAIYRLALYDFKKGLEASLNSSKNHDELLKKLICDLEKAASFGESKAFTVMGLALEESDPAGAAQYYYKGVLEQEKESLYKLGQIYLKGSSAIKANPEAGVVLLKEALALGCVHAHVPLGEAYLQGAGTPKDNSAAMGHFLAAAMKEIPAGMFQYGRMLLEGTAGFTDKKQGLEWIGKAVDQKDLQAMTYFWKYATETMNDPGMGMEMVLKKIRFGLRNQKNWHAFSHITDTEEFFDFFR